MMCRSARNGSKLWSVIIPGLMLGVVLETTALAEVHQQVVEENRMLIPMALGDKDGVVERGVGEIARGKRLFHLPGKLVVKLRPGMKPARLSMGEAHGKVRLSERRLANQSHQRFRDVYLVSAGEQVELATLAAQLRANEAVEYVEPISLSYTQLVPNDPLYPQQWSHQRTAAEAGWNITTGNSSAVVAVVDTGVDYNHPDLSANIWRDVQGNPGKDLVDIDINDYFNEGYWLVPGEDYQGIDNDPSDYYGHGTHVAGIVAASGNNGIGVSGVCPGCRIMPVRAGFALRQGNNVYGVFESDDIADAIVYAADNGAKVINMSFGGPPSQLIRDAIDYAHAKGVALVAAAGNENLSSTDYAYPAAYENVLAVAATGWNDQKAAYSNYGSWVDVAAPGGELGRPILSTVPASGSSGHPSGYGNMHGTSMAAPYVAGSAGLVLSRLPALTSHQLLQAIRQGVDVFNVDIANSEQYLGTGRLNLDRGLGIDAVSTATAHISSPSDDFISGRQLDVTGSVTAPFRLFFGRGIYPAVWTEFGSGQAASDGILATLEQSALPSPFDTYTLKLVAQDQDGRIESIVQGRIGRQFLPGWPQQYSFDGYPAPLWNAPALADLDGDGFDEILIAGRDGLSRGIISVFSKDGTLAEGIWPQAAPLVGSSFDFGATAGDLDGDGDLEIVAPVYGIGHSLMCWDRFGNHLWSRVLEPENPALNVRLADVNGDGKLEIVTQTRNSRLYVLDAGGAVLWSYLLGEYDTLYNEKTVAAADFDGDGKSEIIKNVITNIRFEPGDIYRIMGGALLVFNADGTVRWKHDWPEPEESLGPRYWQIFPTGSPLLADVDGDGKQEIMVRVNVWKGDDTGNSSIATRFYAFSKEGGLLPGWPVAVQGFPAFSELAQGDPDLDGRPELVGGAGGKLHAITHTGAFLFPSVELNAVSNPIVTDVTGDGKPDILVNDGSTFRVIGADGSASVLAVKVKDTGFSNVHNTPIATDLDKNGTKDLIFLEWQNRPILWAWDLLVPYAGKLAQSITFNSATMTFCAGPLDLNTLATGGASGEPVTFNLLSGPGMLSGENNATLTITGAGEIVIMASQAGNVLYNPAPDVQQTITVNKAVATVTLGNLNHTYDGAAKHATATTDPAGKGTEISYDGSASAPVNAGSYAVLATIDDINYTGSASGTLVIGKAAATLSLENLTATYDGTAKAVSATTDPAGKTVLISYDGSASAPVSAGSYTVVATIADTNYSGTASGTLVICKATPVVVWGTPAAIFSGTPLSDRQLDAVANVPGTFTYTPSFGYVPPVGEQVLSLLFTPADAINFADATATTTLTVTNQSYSVSFVAGPNGTLNGSASQTVGRGGSTAPVTALPAAGHHFVNWTGTGGFETSRANPLIVSNVTAPLTITAHFQLIDGIVIPAQGKMGPDLSDALRVMRIALGQVPATDHDLVHADVAPLGEQNKPKGDGAIDIYDVIGILRMTVGLL